MGVNEKKVLTKNALKCWYLRWLLAFIFLLAFEVFTVIVSSNILHGWPLTVIKTAALSIPIVYGVALIFVPYFRYINFSYSLYKDKIIINSGFITKKRQSLPIKNIQHIELKAYPFERMFHLATIKIYTSGSEHILPSIKLTDAKHIQNLVYKEFL